MANRAKSKHDLLPFPIIAAAINGNVDAINVVVKHYAGYITALSTRQLYDENGMPYFSLTRKCGAGWRQNSLRAY